MYRIIKIFLGGILILNLIQCVRPDVPHTSSAFDAGVWVGKWVESWQNYDLDLVDKLFLQDDRLTYFSSEKQGAIIGFPAVKQHHQGFGFVPGGKQQPNELWVEDLNCADFGDTAIVTGIWYFKRQDGSQQHGPVTIVYIRGGNKFLISHMNFSNYNNTES